MYCLICVLHKSKIFKDLNFIYYMGEVEITDGKNENSGNDYSEYISSINKNLESDMPVLFTETHERPRAQRRALGSRTDKYSKNRLLFLSDENLSYGGVFKLQPKTRNNCYLMLDCENYTIVNQDSDKLGNDKLSVPIKWTMEHICEYSSSTYSSGIKWNSLTDKGIEEIIVGDILNKQYFEAINSLKFARDAVYFKLGVSYFDSISRVNQIDESKTKLYEAKKLTCLNAAMSLLDEAKKEQHILGNHNVQATQIGCYSTGAQSFQNNGRPVGDTDYLIHRGGKRFAIVKIGGGPNVREMYILPYKGEESLVECAFSNDMIKKHYPDGCQE